MDDLIKSLKAQLYDRVTSPLLSSFLIAWVAWNHRLFVVMFSSDFKTPQKFQYADETLFPTWKEVLGHGFAWPLLSALFILLIYPYPSRWIYERVRDDQRRLKQIQQRIEDETPVTIAEARELRATIRRAEELVDNKDKIIAGLRANIATLETTVASQEAQLKQVSVGTYTSDPSVPHLNQRQRKMLAFIADKGQAWLGELTKTSREQPIVIEHEADELVSAGLVGETFSGDRLFSITPKGRAYLVKNDKSLVGRYLDADVNDLNFDFGTDAPA